MAQLFVAFVLLLYVPALVFRFVANLYIDLSSRKFSNQIEDFFAAAAPSIVMNLVALVILNSVTLWRFADFAVAMPQLLTSTWAEFLHDHAGWIVAYYGTLLSLAAGGGAVYGWVDLLHYEWALPTTMPASAAGVWEELWTIALAVHGFGFTFFEAHKAPLFALVAQPTYVFVRTNDGRKIHGLVDSYDARDDGSITSIRLSEVTRLQDWNKALAETEAYFVRLSGSLVLKWDEVVDLNIADLNTPTTLQRLENDFAAAKQKQAKPRGWLAKIFC